MTQQSGLSNMTRDDLEQYERAWADNMVKFWQEKMMAFSPPVYDTGMLHDSLSALMHPGPVTTTRITSSNMAFTWLRVLATGTEGVTRARMMTRACNSCAVESGKKAEGTAFPVIGSRANTCTASIG